MTAAGQQLPTLETSRLSLRPMTRDDASDVVRWRNSPHVARMMATGRTSLLTIEEHLDWFERTRPHRVDYMIELRSEGRPIGTVSLDRGACPKGARCAESGRIMGDMEALGQGYSKEAAGRWMRFAFSDLELDWVFARTRRDNAANLAIGAALGFEQRSWPDWLDRPEGVWVFSVLTRSAWTHRAATDGSDEPASRGPGS